MFREWRAIFKRPKYLIVMLGVALIPSLYNIIFLSSMWDPYNKVENLPVAVVNKDHAATFQGKTIEIGKDMTKTLEKNKAMDFHIVDEKKAKEGLKEGDYYMVVTLPEDLSEKAASVMANNPQKAEIEYQTSAGHSFIASKMSDSAVNSMKASVSEKITTSYTSTLFKNMQTLKSGIHQAADGSQQLTDGAGKLQTGSETLSSGLNTLNTATGTLASGASTLHNGVVTYTNGVNQVATGAQTLDANSQKLNDGMSQLTSGLEAIQQQLNNNPIPEEKKAKLQELSSALATAQANLASIDTSMNTSTISNKLATVKGTLSALGQAIASDRAAILANVQSTAAYQSLPADQQAQIAQAVSDSNSETASNVSGLIGIIDGIEADLGSLSNTSLNDLKEKAVSALGTAQGDVDQMVTLMSSVQTLQTVFNDQLVPGAQTLQGGLVTYTNGVHQLATGAQTLDANSGQLTSGTSQLASGANQLSEGADKLANGGQTLTNGIGTLYGGASKLTTGLQTADQKLGLVSMKENNAEVLSAPVTTKKSDDSNVDKNGIGMAPYMLSVALFVAAISTNMVFAVLPSGRHPKNKWAFFKSRLEVNGVIAVVAAILVYGAVHLLGLTANYEMKTLGLLILTSATFMAMVTALITIDNKVGSFLSLILLLLQLASSAGTYPLQLTEKIYQNLNPWLPMSYSVSGLRETISLNGNIGTQTTFLFLALGISTAVAVLAYNPEKLKAKEASAK